MLAQQVKFTITNKDGKETKELGGILVDNRYLICGCCGGVYDLEDDPNEYKEEIHIVAHYDVWVNISDWILD